MLYLLRLGLMLSASIVFISEDQSPIVDDKLQLQGTWEVIASKQNGEDSTRAVGDQVQFNGDRMTVKPKNENDSAPPKMTFKLNPSASPKQIDVTAEIDTESKTAAGVYELSGDTLKLCLGRPDGERPNSLESAADSFQISLTLKRVK